MLGGAKSQFDGDIIMKIEKGKTFKQNEVFHDKNRYQNKDLSLLRYNIYSKSLYGGFKNDSKQSQINEVESIWKDIVIDV